MEIIHRGQSILYIPLTDQMSSMWATPVISERHSVKDVLFVCLFLDHHPRLQRTPPETVTTVMTFHLQLRWQKLL